MDIESYVKKMSVGDQIKIMEVSLGVVCDGLVYLFINWRRTYDKQCPTESDAIAQCILQIAICKIRTLLAMCNGISVDSNNQFLKVTDIPSMISVLRSLYELTFIFHNIYAEQGSETERDIVLYIWEIRGLNNRQNLSYVPEMFKKKEKNEKEQIQDLIVKVESLASKLNMSEDIMQQLHKVVTSKSVDIKGYRFRKHSVSNQIIAFDDIRYEDGAENLLKTDAPAYRFLSIHGHPSYLGVLQFGQMFNIGEDKDFQRTILTCACKLVSKMAIDFRDHISGAGDIFNNLDQQTKEYISIFYNG